MHCCIDCFSDSEIKAIIRAKNEKGVCDFCGCKDTYVFDLDADSTLSELFEEVLDVYSPIADLPADFPRENTDLMKNVLANYWNIFNVSPEIVYRLLTSICKERYSQQPELFDAPVGIRQIQDEDYLREHSILKTYHWADFVEGIKTINRFHSDYINTEKLLVFLRCTIKKHRKGKNLFRSRICHNEEKYKPSEMGPPPVGQSKGGRINPLGISVLYLADSKDTTLYEVRAGVYDYVTIGRFKLLKDIEVVNLADIDKISPFVGDRFGFDKTEYAINLEHLRMIGQEIARPMRNDGNLDYLPTQYISDFIKSKGFSGIEYISTMHGGGTNLAVFDPKLFRCTATALYDVKTIFYQYDPVK